MDDTSSNEETEEEEEANLCLMENIASEGSNSELCPKLIKI